MDTALYFPFIRVPQTPWFTQVLLYWDAAAAIIPAGLERDEAYLGTYMSELVREGVLQIERPDEALDRRSDEFEAEFLALLATREPAPVDANSRWKKIHTGKLGWSLFSELVQKGLAHRSDGPGWASWWEVEERTAMLYLAYLAGAICGTRKGILPVTDTSHSVANLGRADLSMSARLQALRYTTIMHALPAPVEPVSVRQLRSFKEDHQDSLRRLRLHLDGRLADLAAIDDDELRRVKTDSVLQEIRDEVAVLREQMTKRDWPRVVLTGVGGVIGAALALASTVATGGSALALGLAVGSGVTALGSASYQAAEIVRAPRFDRHAPLVYAALAQRL